MSFSAQELFGDISDLDGFSDDENTTVDRQITKRKSDFEGTFSSNKRICKDSWKRISSNVRQGFQDSKNSNVVKELYSGIRLTKPLVSSDELNVMMQGRKMIKLSNLKPNINKSTKDIDCDWVTIGVIVNKMTKVSKNGKDYSIWNLSDLSSEKVTSFFLFGLVHEKHWKLPVGSVIGLLNSSFMDKNKQKNSQNINEVGPLTIDDPDKLLHIGTSKDLGYCKAIKKNGDVCGSLITRADDEFCLYHIKNAYRKFSSKRAEIQSTFSNKEPEQYHFANNFAPNATLKQNNIVLEMNTLNMSQMKDKKEMEANNLKKIMTNPLSRSAKSLVAISKSLPKTLGKHPNNDFKNNLPINAQDIFSQLKYSQLKKDNSPILAKGYHQGQMIDLKISPKDSQMDLNKMRAIEIFKNKKQNALPISSCVSKSMSSKNKKLEQILKKVDANLNESNEELKRKISETEKEKMKIVDEALKRKSINDDVINVIENTAQEQHFRMLEKREKYENRLTDIKELDVKVITCQTCKYTSTSQSDFCKSQQHQVQFHQAKKRFFVCKNCHRRKFTYDSIFPSDECQNCGSVSFEKTSMINVKTETKLGNDLLVRGEEIQFLNSLR